MNARILRSPADLNSADIHSLYATFEAPVTAVDCGRMCAEHNPSGKPFCCDICQAVPVAYSSEWDMLNKVTDLWHLWHADECPGDDEPVSQDVHIRAATPPGMRLLACRGPLACQREYRLLSCRQFPFFPYVTPDYRFLGLAYDWEFEQTCWVISNLGQVTDNYREQFVSTYDQLIAWFQDEFESYAIRSEEIRRSFAAQKRRIPILHRDGGYHLLSPLSGRIERVEPSRLPRFGPYRQASSAIATSGLLPA
jgi:hypothetical protein